jgi:hypothetical protein
MEAWRGDLDDASFNLSPDSREGFKIFEKVTIRQTTAGAVSFALAELLRVSGTIK